MMFSSLASLNHKIGAVVGVIGKAGSTHENWFVAGLRVWLVFTARGGLALPSKWTQHESQCPRDTPSLSRLATPPFF